MLDGVRALVETYSTHGVDSSKPVVRKLAKLGARVQEASTNLTNAAIEKSTHLVWTNGPKKRLEKILSLNPTIFVVKPLWIQQCEDEGQKVDERDFLIEDVLFEANKTKPRSMEPNLSKKITKPTNKRNSGLNIRINYVEKENLKKPDPIFAKGLLAPLKDEKVKKSEKETETDKKNKKHKSSTKKSKTKKVGAEVNNKTILNFFNFTSPPKSRKRARSKEPEAIVVGISGDMTMSKEIEGYCVQLGFEYSTNPTADLTHLIILSNPPKRTEKVMFAVAKGTSLVSQDWLDACISKNDCVNEEPFLIDFHGAQLSRIAHMKKEKGGVFNGLRIGLSNSEMMIQSATLASLVEAASGEIADSAPYDIFVGSEGRTIPKSATKVVRREWIFDSVSHCRLLPIPPRR